MIQELDGATPEPTRRRHVVGLSAATAAVSLVLLYTMLGPPAQVGTPPLAAPSPGSTTGMMVISASDPGSTVVRYDQVAPLRNDEPSSFCVAGIGSSPPVHLVFDRSGKLIAAYSSGRTGRFIQLPQAYVGSGWLTVPCDTSDVFAPRLNRAR